MKFFQELDYLVKMQTSLCLLLTFTKKYFSPQLLLGKVFHGYEYLITSFLEIRWYS